MTVMEAARQLGVCIQADERYLAYRDATLAVEKDEQVKALGENLDELQKQYEAEAVKDAPDEKVMSDLQQQGSAMYQAIYQTPAMSALMDAKEGMDGMMNEVMNLLYLCMGDADPMTVEVTEETMAKMQQEMMQIQM
ncbi:MAG: YlbF family regulator [Clostridia bacterium]|nr:YlbF family regulator [Clostridia bacterium]